MKLRRRIVANEIITGLHDDVRNSYQQFRNGKKEAISRKQAAKEQVWEGES